MVHAIDFSTRKARVSPFMDDDDGPAFEYLEEEEFDDDMETAQKEAEEQQEPPPIDEDFAITISRPVTSVPPPVSPPQPHVPHAPVTPRSKIVTAKEQNKRLKARESHRERAGENAIDADFECEIVSDEEGLDWRGRSRGKRGRTGSTGQAGVESRGKDEEFLCTGLLPANSNFFMKQPRNKCF